MISAIAIDSTKLETHYLQREYSEGADFLCAPFCG